MLRQHAEAAQLHEERSKRLKVYHENSNKDFDSARTDRFKCPRCCYYPNYYNCTRRTSERATSWSATHAAQICIVCGREAGDHFVPVHLRGVDAVGLGL